MSRAASWPGVPGRDQLPLQLAPTAAVRAHSADRRAQVRGVDFTVPGDYVQRAAHTVGFDELAHLQTGEHRHECGDQEVPRGLERACRAAWTRIAEPGNRAAHVLIAAIGPVAALAVAADTNGAAQDRYQARLAQLDVRRDFEIAARVGARLVIPTDPEWPSGVDDLPAPPVALWVRGSVGLGLACTPSVAIVGARASSAYGDDLASELGWALAERGLGIVSGAAFGIDAAAHRGALAVEGVSVAVLACGIERAYPLAHADLIDDIAARGAVVSEVAPGSAALRSRFLERNRLIATMSQGTIVVESGLRSGAHNTARTAAVHHRIVMAVPGSVRSPSSAGAHQLIRDRVAELVTDAQDVIELLAPVGLGMGAPQRGPTRPRDGLTADEQAVIDALGPKARSEAKIAEVTGLSGRGVTALLGRLEAAGLAQRGTAGWQMVRGSPSG